MVAEVWETEPHAAVLPALQLQVEGGVVVTAHDVEIFRVNSLGGAPASPPPPAVSLHSCLLL